MGLPGLVAGGVLQPQLRKKRVHHTQGQGRVGSVSGHMPLWESNIPLMHMPTHRPDWVRYTIIALVCLLTLPRCQLLSSNIRWSACTTV